jgi:hypothetical protein
MEEAVNAADHISSLLEQSEAIRDGIVAVRDREIYNFRGAAHAGAAVIDDLID